MVSESVKQLQTMITSEKSRILRMEQVQWRYGEGRWKVSKSKKRGLFENLHSG